MKPSKRPAVPKSSDSLPSEEGARLDELERQRMEDESGISAPESPRGADGASDEEKKSDDEYPEED